jgi:diacylglycerol kinase family enzyme
MLPKPSASSTNELSASPKRRDVKKLSNTTSPYTAAAIIYNPNSTGSGKDLARQLKTDLASAVPGLAVTLIPTEHPGHGEELAYELATATKHPLIISSSGDGGYHEVVNGLMRAIREGATPVAGLLPAGNANDHFHSLHKGDVAAAIAAGHERSIDLLKLAATVDGRPFERYAHSYIGLGLTPQAGHELNQTKLNLIKEIGIVLKVLFFLRPVRLIVHNHPRLYDSLIFSNIEKMSKVLSLAEQAAPTDGKFEITAFRRRNKLRLIASLIRASTTGLKGATQATSFQFRTTHSTLTQLDGEIITLDAATDARIALQPSALSCII